MTNFSWTGCITVLSCVSAIAFGLTCTAWLQPVIDSHSFATASVAHLLSVQKVLTRNADAMQCCKWVFCLLYCGWVRAHIQCTMGCLYGEMKSFASVQLGPCTPSNFVFVLNSHARSSLKEESSACTMIYFPSAPDYTSLWSLTWFSSEMALFVAT